MLRDHRAAHLDASRRACAPAAMPQTASLRPTLHREFAISGDTPMRTQVAIIGAGPAGLLLGQLLHRPASTTSSSSARAATTCCGRIRAGVLEQVTMDLLARPASTRAPGRRPAARRHRAAVPGRAPPHRPARPDRRQAGHGVRPDRGDARPDGSARGRRPDHDLQTPRQVSLHDFDGAPAARALRRRTAPRTRSNATSSPAATATTASAARACRRGRCTPTRRSTPSAGWACWPTCRRCRTS